MTTETIKIKSRALRHQLSGASKMFFLLNCLMFAMTFYVLTDNRHALFVLQHENCEMQTISIAARQAYDAMQPR